MEHKNQTAVADGSLLLKTALLILFRNEFYSTHVHTERTFWSTWFRDFIKTINLHQWMQGNYSSFDLLTAWKSR